MDFEGNLYSLAPERKARPDYKNTGLSFIWRSLRVAGYCIGHFCMCGIFWFPFKPVTRVFGTKFNFFQRCIPYLMTLLLWGSLCGWGMVESAGKPYKGPGDGFIIFMGALIGGMTIFCNVMGNPKDMSKEETVASLGFTKNGFY